jgi:hypothetical protein
MMKLIIEYHEIIVLWIRDLFPLCYHVIASAAAIIASIASYRAIKQYQENSRPFLSIYAQKEKGAPILNIIIENLGKTAAKNVKFRWFLTGVNNYKLPLKIWEKEAVNHTDHCFNNGILNIQPHQLIKAMFGEGVTVLGLFNNEDKQLSVEISYSDEKHRLYKEKTVFDFSIFRDERIVDSPIDVKLSSPINVKLSS